MIFIIGYYDNIILQIFMKILRLSIVEYNKYNKGKNLMLS